jgi:hypothetical protein
MTGISEELSVVRRLVVIFDTCSSTTILEALKRTDNLAIWRDLHIAMKAYLLEQGSSLGMEPYKFIGDGWILLFSEKVPRDRLCQFLTNLSVWFEGHFQARISPLLAHQPRPLGLMYGIDAGELIRLEINENVEYLGRAINVAARLQGETKHLVGGPSYKALFSRNSFFAGGSAPANVEHSSVVVNLRNISDGQSYQCILFQAKAYQPDLAETVAGELRVTPDSDRVLPAQPLSSRNSLLGISAVVLAVLVGPLIFGNPSAGFAARAMVAILAVAGVVSHYVPRPSSAAKPFRLQPSFTSGWFGGMIGGAVAGALASPWYYVLNRTLTGVGWTALFAEILLYSTILGLFLGTFSQLCILLAKHARSEKQYPLILFNEITAGMLGGALGGLLSGTLGGLVFGSVRARPVPPVMTITLGVVGALFVCGGALFYEYRGSVIKAVRAFVASLIAVVIAATSGVWLLLAMRFGDGAKATGLMEHFFLSPDLNLHAQGGALLGGVVGCTLGLQIGCTLLLYRSVFSVTDGP